MQSFGMLLNRPQYTFSRYCFVHQQILGKSRPYSIGTILRPPIRVHNSTSSVSPAAPPRQSGLPDGQRMAPADLEAVWAAACETIAITLPSRGDVKDVQTEHIRCGAHNRPDRQGRLFYFDAHPAANGDFIQYRRYTAAGRVRT